MLSGIGFSESQGNYHPSRRVFPRIKGAYGVENGTVEVVDVEKDTVIASYPVSFFPVG